MSEENVDLAPETKRLLSATKPFAEEIPFTSWWHVASTFVLLGAVLIGAAVLPWWPLQLAASVVAGLVTVQAFILFHDFMHYALLYRSRLGKVIFSLFGLLVLTPPRYWRYSHNFHHAHVGKPITGRSGSIPLITSDVGSFPLMSTEQWRGASTWQRLQYRLVRHPVTILMAYVTVFFFGLCVVPLVKDPRKYWDGALAILAHGGLIAGLWAFAGLPVAFFAVVLPIAVAAALGAYTFYAQHNFEGMRVVPSDDWSFYQGALQSSGYMKLGPIMDWFTGNIGYHHIHHLNSRIPFYRLPEVMAAVPELRMARVTTLRPHDILKCFRLNLWDVDQQRLVGYREATKPPQPVDGQIPKDSA
jgi:acyl-lipid omega-6 desaturase (Delta-12 desaturase)